jgi:hypothetical protein
MTEQEQVERSLAETLKMLKEQYPDIQGKPNPMFEIIKQQLESTLLDPDKRHEMMARHHAGATVTPINPFGDLEILRNTHDLSRAFIEQWVVPYYSKIPFSISENTFQRLKSIKKSITKQAIEMLLGDFNWRTRSVGAYFAAITKQYDLFPIIGNMLLQSEVCIAGKTYAIALASYVPEFSIPIYLQYLKYYLTQPQYDFDQREVYAALLIQASGKPEYELELLEMQSLWKSFISQRHFNESMDMREEVERVESPLATLITVRDT